MGSDERYPDELDAFLDRCHDAGQTRPTPLIVRYGSAHELRLPLGSVISAGVGSLRAVGPGR
ncbi:MAG: 2OG-Fe(II) oxygenase [Pseudonocardiaceae bacterium]